MPSSNRLAAAVTSTPPTMAAKYIGTPLTAPNTATIGPPCGTESVTPASAAIPPATAPPIMLAGMTCRGFAAANGIAPSVIPKKPMNRAAIPASCSGLLKYLRRSSVAIPIPSGGTAMAAATIPIGAGLPAAIRALPNRNAVLFTGPPMSKATIAPRSTPRSSTLPPSRPLRKLVRLAKTHAMGWPRTRMKAPPTMIVVRIGITRIGMIGLMN